MENYAKYFLIGTTLPLVFHHYLGVILTDESKKNYSFETYVFIAPLYFGLMNVFSVFLQKKYDLTTTQRFLLIGAISGILIAVFAYILGTYNYTNTEWAHYMMTIFITHMFDFNILLRGIEYIILSL